MITATCEAIDIKARLKRIAEQHQQHQQQKNAAVIEVRPEPKNEAIGEQMTFFPETVGAMPTEITRTSLFSLLPIKQGGSRQIYSDMKIEARRDVTLFYSGTALDKLDETAWMCVLRLCRDVRMGERKYLRMPDVLRELGMTDTEPNRVAVAARLERLSKAVITIEFSRGKKTMRVITGLMKMGYETDSESKPLASSQMYLRLDPDGAKLFDNLSYQPWEIRTALHSPTAMALMTYASGHEAGKPHTVKLEDLKKMTGHEGRPRVFRENILAAIEELERLGFFAKAGSCIKGAGKLQMVSWTRSK